MFLLLHLAVPPLVFAGPLKKQGQLLPMRVAAVLGVRVARKLLAERTRARALVQRLLKKSFHMTPNMCQALILGGCCEGSTNTVLVRGPMLAVMKSSGLRLSGASGMISTMKLST